MPGFRETQRRRVEQLLVSQKRDVPAVPDLAGRLIRNALDFVVRATEDLWSATQPTQRELKYSTIHLYEAIEILLKARLMQEHWSLVLVDREIGKKTYNGLLGKFRSVDYKVAKERLANVSGIDIEGRADRAFDELGDLRNRFVHFECSERPEIVLSIQLRGWHYVLALLEDGFLDPLDAEERAILGQASSAMHRSEAFLETRFEEVEEEIDAQRGAGRLVATCPKCAQNLCSGTATSDALSAVRIGGIQRTQPSPSTCPKLTSTRSKPSRASAADTDVRSPAPRRRTARARR